MKTKVLEARHYQDQSNEALDKFYPQPGASEPSDLVDGQLDLSRHKFINLYSFTVQVLGLQCTQILPSRNQNMGKRKDTQIKEIALSIENNCPIK